MPNKISQFWQELKRRNVLRVSTLYVAIAFGMMELVDILSGPLNLPSLALILVMLLAALGLPLTIVLSWFFLLTPEGIRRYKHLADEIRIEKKEEPLSNQGEQLADNALADGLIVYETDLPKFSALGKTSKRRSRVYGLSSLTTVILVTAFFLFYSGKSTPFQERDWVVLADFANRTGEEIFNSSLNTAFEISIDQSRHINVISRTRVQEALKRMGRDTRTAIDEKVCGEIAIREGARAYIVPEISRVGHQYILIGKLYETESGRIVASEMVYSENQDEIIGQLDRISRRLRRHLGESRYKISGQSKPLARVNTSSLDALKQYSLGIEAHTAMDFEKAVICYRNAIGMDSTFAAAKASLGILLYDHFDKEEAKRWLDDAILAQDDLAEKMKNKVLSFYAAFILHDLDQAIRYGELNIQLYPDDVASRNNLGWLMRNQGRYREATKHYRKAIDIDPYVMLPYGNLIWIFNEFTGEADSVIFWANKMLEYAPDNGWTYFYLGSGYFPKGDTILAEESFERCAELMPGLELNKYRLANTKRVMGKYTEAVETLQDILNLNPASSHAYYQKGINYQLMGRYEEARAQYEYFLDHTKQWLAIHPEDIDYLYYNALAKIRLGEVDKGLQAGKKIYGMDTTRHMDYAMVLAVQGDIDQALDQVDWALDNGYRDFCWIKMNPDLANLQEEERFRNSLDEYFN